MSIAMVVEQLSEFAKAYLPGELITVPHVVTGMGASGDAVHTATTRNTHIEIQFCGLESRIFTSKEGKFPNCRKGARRTQE